MVCMRGCTSKGAAVITWVMTEVPVSRGRRGGWSVDEATDLWNHLFHCPSLRPACTVSSGPNFVGGPFALIMSTMAFDE